jgi:glycine/D-amino acid oxidase-like deaminating enzyme
MSYHQHLATRARKLTDGTSIWAHSRGRGVLSRKLDRSIKADVVIVGAGVSGAFMADALSKRHAHVVVLDRREPVHGSTLASTAMLQFEIDVPLIELADKIGTRNARAAWVRSWRATQHLIRLVRRERIGCGLSERDTLYLAGNAMGFRALKDEARARNDAGLPGAYLNGAGLRARFGMDRTGAIFSPGSAVANPAQLAAGLLRRAVERGATVYSPVGVKSADADAKRVVLDTGEHFIEAKTCIFCTGYEILKGVPTKGTKIASTWAIASQPHTRFPGWLEKTIVWEASKPYLYFRSMGDRLVIGGEDEDVDQPGYRAKSLDGKARRLVRKTEELLPDVRVHAAYKWTGAFGESTDGLPIIDRVPDMPGCYAVLGFGGNGTIYSLIASEIVPTLMAGKPDADAHLYRFR